LLGFRRPLRRIWHVPRAVSFYAMMKTYLAEPLLNEPIVKLGLSEEFCLITETLGFHTLADLLQHRMPDLLALPGFDHRIWNEYAAFLEQHRIGHYLN